MVPQLSGLEFAIVRLRMAVLLELEKCTKHEPLFQDSPCDSNLVAGQGLLPTVGQRWVGM